MQDSEKKVKPKTDTTKDENSKSLSEVKKIRGKWKTQWKSTPEPEKNVCKSTDELFEH